MIPRVHPARPLGKPGKGWNSEEAAGGFGLPAPIDKLRVVRPLPSTAALPHLLGESECAIGRGDLSAAVSSAKSFDAPRMCATIRFCNSIPGVKANPAASISGA